MSYRAGRQTQTKAHQLVLPFPGWGRRRADNDDDPFSASGTNPTRGVFNGHDVRKQPAKFRGGLTLADLGAYVGPANDYPEGYRR